MATQNQIKNKKILITGGAGFIGSHLADRLIDQGQRVFVIDNLYLGRLANIKHLLKNKRFSFHKFDLLNFKKTSEFFKKEGFDMVFHLAANSDVANSIRDRKIDWKLNLETTRSVLEAMRSSKCKKIVFASSSAVYQPSEKKLEENSGPFYPISLYGASKLAAEGCISAYCNNFDLQCWIVRFANVVGSRATHGVILDFIKKLRKNPGVLTVLGNGRQSKPYIHVSDLINGVLFFINKTKGQLNCVNLGTSDKFKVKDIATAVCKGMGLQPKILYTGGNIGWVGDVKTYGFNLDKIKKMGWQARLSSRQAIEKAVKEMTPNS